MALSEEVRLEIRALLREGSKSSPSIARTLGISTRTVAGIKGHLAREAARTEWCNAKSVESAALVQGIIFSLLGLILVGLSGKLARMPREHKALFLRLPLFGETALARLVERDRFIQIARGFWIFCGLLGLVGGVLILLNLSPPITLPPITLPVTRT